MKEKDRIAGRPETDGVGFAPSFKDRIVQWRALRLVGLTGIALAAMLAGSICGESVVQRSPQITPTAPSPLECVRHPDTLGVPISEKETVGTYKKGVIVNKVSGLHVHLTTDSLDKLASDPELGIPSAENIQIITFLLQYSLSNEEDVKDALSFMEQQNLFYYLYRHCYEWGTTSGQDFARAISITDLLRDIQKRYPDREIGDPFYNLALSVDLSYAWVKQNMEYQQQLLSDQVSGFQFSPEQRFKIVQSLPIRVTQIEPRVFQAVGIHVVPNIN